MLAQANRRDAALRNVPIVLGGAVVLLGMRRRSLGGTTLALAGAGLAAANLALQRRRSGLYNEEGPLGLTTSVTIARPADELYAFWRRPENLPRFMAHLKSVTAVDEKRSRWVAKVPGGRTVEWDSDIVEDARNRRIVWRAQVGAFPHTASVDFRPAPGNRGTIVRLGLSYGLSGGRPSREAS